MQRIFGALAVFAGWLCILGSAALGLVATEFLGLKHTEGPLPVSSVYGVPEVIVLWILVGAALLAMIPVGSSVASANPSRLLYATAAVMAVTAVALLPDDLGRVHAAAILPGAILFAIGASLLRAADSEADTTAAAASTQGSVAGDPAAPLPNQSADAASAAPALPAAAPRPTPRSAKKARSPRSQGDRECPWCSTPHRKGAVRCSACGAALKADPEVQAEAIPGLTVVAPTLLAYEQKVRENKKKKSGLVSLVMGEKDERLPEASAADAPPSAYLPPSDDVRLEMARLERELAASSSTQAEGSAETPPSDPPRS